MRKPAFNYPLSDRIHSRSIWISGKISETASTIHIGSAIRRTSHH